VSWAVPSRMHPSTRFAGNSVHSRAMLIAVPGQYLGPLVQPPDSMSCQKLATVAGVPRHPLRTSPPYARCHSPTLAIRSECSRGASRMSTPADVVACFLLHRWEIPKRARCIRRARPWGFDQPHSAMTRGRWGASRVRLCPSARGETRGPGALVWSYPFTVIPERDWLCVSSARGGPELQFLLSPVSDRPSARN